MATSDIYQEDHHWGSGIVEVDQHDLPALKTHFLLDALPRTGRVVEIGCGGGRLLNTIAAHHPALELHGCDIRPLASPPSRFTFTQVDPDDVDLPYPPSSCDTVILFDVLEHLLDPERTLRAVHKILKPGATIVSFTPLEGQPLSFYKLYRKVFGDDLYVETKEHVQAFSERSLRALIARDFVIRRCEYAYHLLGHLMDATLFALMKLPWVRKRFWQDNPFYAEEEQAPDQTAPLAIALRSANAIAYAESRALRHHAFGAAGMLFIATAR